MKISVAVRVSPCGSVANPKMVSPQLKHKPLNLRLQMFEVDQQSNLESCSLQVVQYLRLMDRNLCKTSSFAQFRRQAQILSLEILNVSQHNLLSQHSSIIFYLLSQHSSIPASQYPSIPASQHSSIPALFFISYPSIPA